MKPKISPQRAMEIMWQRGVYSLRGMARHQAITQFLSQVTLTRTGKRGRSYRGS